MTEHDCAIDLPDQPRVFGLLERGHRQAALPERRLERVQVAAFLGRSEQQRPPDAG
jgi:hypothetical protein